MLADISNYRPEEIDFVLDDAELEKYPRVIFEGAKSVEEILKIVNDKFISIFPEKEVCLRNLDDFEKNNIREEYCQIEENELPAAIKEQLDAYEEAKRMKKEADDNLISIQKRIRDLAAQVKEGTTDFKLSSKNTIRIAVDKHFLYYSWVDNKFQLVKTCVIPEWDANSLWSQEEKNHQAMKELFGYDFGEVNKPSNSDMESDDDSDEDPDDDQDAF